MSNSVDVQTPQAAGAVGPPVSGDADATTTMGAPTAPIVAEMPTPTSTASSPTPPPSSTLPDQHQHQHHQREEAHHSAPAPAATSNNSQTIEADAHVIAPSASHLNDAPPPPTTAAPTTDSSTLAPVPAPAVEPHGMPAPAVSPSSNGISEAMAAGGMEETVQKKAPPPHVGAPATPTMQPGAATAPVMETPRHQLVNATAPTRSDQVSAVQSSTVQTPLASSHQQATPVSPLPLTPAPSAARKVALSPSLAVRTPSTSTSKFSRARESRRTFTAEDGKTYFLPKCVHFRAESDKHARSSLHLQLSAGLYLCNGIRCSDKGGNVDFKASHIVTKDEVLVLRAFRDLMGWRPHGSPAAPLHELLCAEIFRLYEKSRRSSALAAALETEGGNAASPTASAPVDVAEIGDDEVISISPAAHKVGDDLPAHAIAVTHKAGYLRQVNKEKRRRCTEIYEALARDPAILSGTLTEATTTATRPQYSKPVKPTTAFIDVGTGIPFIDNVPNANPGPPATVLTASFIGDGPRDSAGPVTFPARQIPFAASAGGASAAPTSSAVQAGGAPDDAAVNSAALSNLLSTFASRWGPAPTAASTANESDGDAGLPETRILAGTRGSDGGEGPAAKRPRIDVDHGTSDKPNGTDGGGSRTGNGVAAMSPAAPRSESPPFNAEPQGGGGSASSTTVAPPRKSGVSAFQSEVAASAARRQVWYREVKANDAHLEKMKQDADRAHSARMRELMNWIVDEEAGKHAGMEMDGSPALAPWDRR